MPRRDGRKKFFSSTQSKRKRLGRKRESRLSKRGKH